jgi:YfiH family protein
VHGARVVPAEDCRGAVEADGVVAHAKAASDAVVIGVVTADCLPVLVASEDGRAVAALHAGWRGLAAGILGVGVDALRRESGASPLVAAIGPHVGPCCYEVDAPVIDAMRYFDADLDAASRASRPGHWWLDLGVLARAALRRAGLADERIGAFDDACTACGEERFHSYRRDGPRAGRLVHWIAPRSPAAP